MPGAVPRPQPPSAARPWGARGRTRPAGAWLAPLAAALGTAALLGSCARPAAGPPPGGIRAVQLAWRAWPVSTFRQLADQGLNRAELNLEWGALEPQPGRFSFGVLDADLAAAAAAHVELIPIFWESVWTGNPAPWVTSRDITSTGATAAIPAWWNPAARQAYFTYVTTTVAHIRRSPGFGGAFLNYGWLDATWGQPPSPAAGVTGYAPDDVAEFHRWLPLEFRSLRAFNRAYATHYASWDSVPAARPGQPGFAVYQAFRAWSVQETYARLTARVRRETSAPLYYYWGGDLSNEPAFLNLPDSFFALARRYRVTVVLDDAENTGLAVLFGSLARAYGVPLLQEWTPAGSGYAAEAARWLGHEGLGAPEAAGLDFFLFQGGREYAAGFPVFARWAAPLGAMDGAYPQQPVALYVSFASAFRSADALTGTSAEIGALWSEAHVGLQVVTDRELAAGVARLSAFRAVLPVTGPDAALRAYAAQGGHVVGSAAALEAYASPYASFAPAAAGLVEAVPVAAPASRRAWISIAAVNPTWPYSGTVTILPGGLGLPAGAYHLVEEPGGQQVPYRAVAGGLAVPLDLAPGAFELWELAAGAGSLPPPAGPSAAPGAPAASTVAAVAGQAPAGLAFLGVGAAAAGSDGNLDLVAQGGLQAVATWPTGRSRTPGSFVYLQIDPSSPVDAAAAVRVQVTYLATPGQGFQVQYDGTGGPYEPGPSVASPGTGAWTTATVTLRGARFDEGQNGGADLRLFARDGSQPLVVREVEISAAS